jgi:diguanylate cyclase (GGDEF)-like protein/PAS domain S-box-containing protein
VPQIRKDPTAAGAALTQRLVDFGAVFEAVPDAMVGVDRAGRIRLINGQAEAMFGYARGSLVGRLIETLLPESIRQVQDAQREGYVTDPRSRAGAVTDVVGCRHDGTAFPADVGLTHIGTGDDLLVIAAVRDMTARHESEESRRRADRMSAVVEFSGDAIIAGTLDGIITNWNPAAERLFGYASREILGSSASLLSAKDRLHDLDVVLARINAGEPDVKLTTIGARKGGETFPVSLTISAICDEEGTPVGTSAIARDITEDRRSFEAAQRIAAIVESSDDAILGKTLDGIITSWNSAAEKMYGYRSEEIVGKHVVVLSHPDRAGEIQALLATVRAGEHVDHFETIRVRKDGTVFPVSLTVSPICDPEGAVVGASAIARDVTVQKMATENARSLAAAENLVSSVMASASMGIALAGKDGRLRAVNRSLCELVGHDEGWLLEHGFQCVIHPDDLAETLRERSRFLAGSGGRSATVLRLVRADGATIWVRRVAVMIPGGNGQQDQLMVQMEDITSEHDTQEALDYQAFHDPLTGLHNRAWILDILQRDLHVAKRRGTSVGTLFVDLDNLKVVNDSLGHAAGDEVLVAVAERIESALRPGDRVGRFGGDEFVIVVQDVHEVPEVQACAERISASIAADLQVQGHRIVPTASIGIAVSSSTSTPGSLLRDTDSALFRAKAAGRASWRFFDAAMHAEAMARLTTEGELRDAITLGEFVVHYQRIVALADARTVGFEALVRWAHPTRGLLSPGDFLDVAEDTGLITSIGAQVLDQACAILDHRPDLPGTISVNVSAVQLASPDWFSGVTETFARHRVDPARIVIEVTETAVLNLSDFARHAFTSLRKLGVGIHVDDFGTGYSSIALLRDLPVTGVKLDLRFVQDLTNGDSQANALARGLGGLVNGMQLTGIAEGIETKMQAGILLAQGWQCGQGYYFGKPAAIPLNVLNRRRRTIA